MLVKFSCFKLKAGLRHLETLKHKSYVARREESRRAVCLHSDIRQMTVELKPGYCATVTHISDLQTTQIVADFTIPIYGYVSVWFKEPAYISSQTGWKQNWQIPVGTLLSIAEVRALHTIQHMLRG